MNLIPKSFYLDDFFDNFVSNKENNALKCDIYEKNGKYIVEMDIPGFKKEDISLEVEDGYLTIIASKKDTKEEENKNYIRRERYVNEYKRRLYVGNVQESDIKAKLENGFLKIELPLEEEVSNKKQIEIE